MAFYRCYAPVPVPLAVLVMVAGRRWTIEEPFQTGKGLTGLDEHQVGWWTSWYRWTTLAVVTARERADQPTEPELAPLTLGEIRRLLVRVLIQAAHNVTHLLCWSRWRRRHEARARASDYRRQAFHES
ncbi:hypothetical protein ACGFIB_31735 [Microbispora bryophytorum]|uniref:hypothetical protein n=1 Tax=Microbispora bryophytorum TaxID=1460882 RepID=UPI00371634E7